MLIYLIYLRIIKIIFYILYFKGGFKMKKLIFFILLFTSILAFSELKDGTYSVEKQDDTNYATFVKLIVKNNKVIGVQYDKKNSQGKLYSMDNPTFRDQSLATSRKFVSTQDINDISDSNFRELVNFLLEKANNGQTGDFKK
jgi:pheromone cAD1 o protein